MRILSLGQAIGGSVDAKLEWIIEALRQIELASHEESGEGSSAVSGSAGTAVPLADSGTGAVGTSAKWAHEDHVHPTDTTLATISYVNTQDALKADLDSPNFTGNPRGPTPSPGDNDTSFATTAFVQAAIAAAASPSFDVGTNMLFQQTAAPTGWTKQVSHNDKALRVVSGAASSGGANAFSTVMAQTVVGSTTLTTATIPSHGHGYTAPSPIGAFYDAFGSAQQVYTTTGATTGAAGSGGSHNHSITMNIAYVDVIIATKN